MCILKHVSLGVLFCCHITLKFNSDDADWSGRGCSVAQRGTNFTVCQCTHLTSFAIVMNPEGADEVSHTHCLAQQLLVPSYSDY